MGVSLTRQKRNLFLKYINCTKVSRIRKKQNGYKDITKLASVLLFLSGECAAWWWYFLPLKPSPQPLEVSSALMVQLRWGAPLLARLHPLLNAKYSRSKESFLL